MSSNVIARFLLPFPSIFFFFLSLSLLSWLVIQCNRQLHNTAFLGVFTVEFFFFLHIIEFFVVIEALCSLTFITSYAYRYLCISSDGNYWSQNSEFLLSETQRKLKKKKRKSIHVCTAKKTHA